MEIQPVVLGTAGHIDHGKSTLVRALTGTDPDRLKEEQERGMTIDLGFANFDLPDGRKVGIVDVPGHERFIKNMVAGASGTDMVMLVVAADDGVMPQTREHLAIMNLLGVERGLVALTKIDLVEDEMVELAEEDIRETVTGTFLEGAPVLRVSAVAGRGVEELRAAIAELAANATPRSADAVFRMPIQRVFTVKGFGTVVTGIPVSGQVQTGDTLEIVPGSSKGKVRGLQAYHEGTDAARAGHSTAINLSDVDHKEVHRGCVAATPGYFQPVRMVGARLTSLASLERPIANRTAVRLHTGTAEVLGEVVLLDVPELAPGAEALVQLRLEEPVVAAPGDRFVLRLASPLITLGGGVVLEESRHRLKRFKNFVLEELERQAEGLGSPEELIEVLLSRAGRERRTANELAVLIKQPLDETRALLSKLVKARRVVVVGAERYMHPERLDDAQEALVGAVTAWFDENAHREVADVRDLRAAAGFENDLFAALLDEAERRGTLLPEAGGKVRLPGRGGALPPEVEEQRARVHATLVAGKLQPPLPAEIAGALGMQEKAVLELCELCSDRGEAKRVKDFYVAAEHLDAARQAIVQNCEANGELVIPALRDALGTSRKYLIPLLESFDAEGLTLRQGGRRVLKRR